MTGEGDKRASSVQRGCTRRQILRAGGTALTTSVVGATAGCLDTRAPISREFRYGTVNVPAPTDQDPHYRKWIPAESEVPDFTYTFARPVQYATPGNLGNEQVGVEYRLGFYGAQSALSYFGTEFRDYDHLLEVGTLGGVVESTVDTDRVESTLLDSGFQEAGSYRGYSLFDRTDIPRFVAVSGDAIIQTEEEGRRTKAETVIDAGEGRIDRWHETDESYAGFTESLGAYPTVMENIYPSGDGLQPEEEAMVYTFDDDFPYIIFKHQYQPGETPTKQELNDWLDHEFVGENGTGVVDIEMDGRYVDIKMPVTEDLFGLASINQPTTPFMTWGVNQDSETITIRHEAGDPVPVEKLKIEPEGAVQNPPREGEFGPGDTLTFRKEALEDDLGGYEDIDILYRIGDEMVAVLLWYEPEDNDGTV